MEELNQNALGESPRKEHLQQQQQQSRQNEAGNSGGNSLEENSSVAKDQSQQEECDGYDKVGCYVIRVYYDWFLVPGSCKCWKKQGAAGSLDTFKKLFVGK